MLLKPGSKLAELVGSAQAGIVTECGDGCLVIRLDNDHRVSARAKEWKATGDVLPPSDGAVDGVRYDGDAADLEPFTGE